MNMNAVNEYGLPPHACNGFRHDEHYWGWIRDRVRRGEFGAYLQAMLHDTESEKA